MMIALRDAAEVRALADAAARATEYAEASSADSTRRAYAADWRDFCAFCDRHGLPALPAAPQLVALYVAQLADVRRVSTIRRCLVAITRAHALAEHANPTTDPHARAVVQGVARTHGSSATTSRAHAIARSCSSRSRGDSAARRSPR